MILVYCLKDTYGKENAESLLSSSNEIRLDVNADKTKYMVLYGDQTA
jgi:hypothetical protein